MHGVRVDERDLEPEQPGARLGVDQLGALVREPGERGAQVADLVGDVVHPRPALREKAPDGRLLAEREQQLDAAVADEHGRRLHTLVGHGPAVLERGAEEARVRVHRLVEILDGDAEMVDTARLHAAMLPGQVACAGASRSAGIGERSSQRMPRQAPAAPTSTASRSPSVEPSSPPSSAPAGRTP